MVTDRSILEQALKSSSLVSCREGGKETGEIEYAADTALDHVAMMDENESPVEVHLTKN